MFNARPTEDADCGCERRRDAICYSLWEIISLIEPNPKLLGGHTCAAHEPTAVVVPMPLLSVIFHVLDMVVKNEGEADCTGVLCCSCWRGWRGRMFSQAWIIQTPLHRGHFLRESRRLPPRASGGGENPTQNSKILWWTSLLILAAGE